MVRILIFKPLQFKYFDMCIFAFKQDASKLVIALYSFHLCKAYVRQCEYCFVPLWCVIPILLCFDDLY